MRHLRETSNRKCYALTEKVKDGKGWKSVAIENPGPSPPLPPSGPMPRPGQGAGRPGLPPGSSGRPFLPAGTLPETSSVPNTATGSLPPGGSSGLPHPYPGTPAQIPPSAWGWNTGAAISAPNNFGQRLPAPGQVPILVRPSPTASQPFPSGGPQGQRPPISGVDLQAQYAELYRRGMQFPGHGPCMAVPLRNPNPAHGPATVPRQAQPGQPRHNLPEALLSAATHGQNLEIPVAEQPRYRFQGPQPSTGQSGQKMPLIKAGQPKQSVTPSPPSTGPSDPTTPQIVQPGQTLPSRGPSGPTIPQTGQPGHSQPSGGPTGQKLPLPETGQPTHPTPLPASSVDQKVPTPQSGQPRYRPILPKPSLPGSLPSTGPSGPNVPTSTGQPTHPGPLLSALPSGQKTPIPQTGQRRYRPILPKPSGPHVPIPETGQPTHPAPLPASSVDQKVPTPQSGQPRYRPILPKPSLPGSLPSTAPSGPNVPISTGQPTNPGPLPSASRSGQSMPIPQTGQRILPKPSGPNVPLPETGQPRHLGPSASSEGQKVPVPQPRQPRFRPILPKPSLPGSLPSTGPLPKAGQKRKGPMFTRARHIPGPSGPATPQTGQPKHSLPSAGPSSQKLAIPEAGQPKPSLPSSLPSTGPSGENLPFAPAGQPGQLLPGPFPQGCDQNKVPPIEDGNPDEHVEEDEAQTTGKTF